MHWTFDYLGKPWRNGAAGPDAYDCYGLVRAVYADRYGVQLPVIDTDATKLVACLHALRDYAGYDQWLHVSEPEEGDVLQMGCAHHPHHVGVYVAPGRVLHSVQGAGVVLQPFGSLPLSGWHVLEMYRRRGV